MKPLARRLSWLLVWLLRRPLRAWIRPRLTPTDRAELALDPRRPLCYVLPTASLSDWLTLEAVCQTHGLPAPQSPANRSPAAGGALWLALPRAGAGSGRWGRLAAWAEQEPEFDIQIVPVSIFWGSNPIRQTSLWRILFSHAELPGRLRKLFIVVAQGRKVLVHCGQPLGMRSFVAASRGSTPRKLMRVLREHFRRQRVATLGPPLSQRSQVINAVLADPSVREAIRSAARDENLPVAGVRAQARGYADEIAADYSNIAIGFMLRVLEWLWSRVYTGVEVAHLQRLRGAARDTALVYLPAHRSHMDYLLVSYILYREGIALPQIAAGINLNFWPVGGLLRRCGAFYLRRSIKGNKLYSAVFRSYVDALIGRGAPLKFYPEGGRSRTGRLLAPKTGMLAMVTESFIRRSDCPVALVPVYIGYDRVMEVNSYFSELRGEGAKKGESVAVLLRGARKLLARKLGRAYISFGAPLPLAAYADTHYPDWRQGPAPDRLGAFVDGLARNVMVRINACASLNAVGLVALVLLGSPQKAVAADEMVATLDRFLGLARAAPYSSDTSLPSVGGAAILAEAETLAGLARVPHAWGDVLTIDARQAVLLTYARNNVLHLFALPSLLANYFAHHEERSEEQILNEAAELYPLLAAELFLRWEPAQVAGALQTQTQEMVAQGLLVRVGEGPLLRRPAVGSHEFTALMALARIMGEALERYAMTAVLLAHNLPGGTVERSACERQCQLMAERMAILSGRNSPEFFDLGLFRNHLETLTRNGLLHPQGGRLAIEPALAPLAERVLQLLGPDIRQGIVHLIRAR